MFQEPLWMVIFYSIPESIILISFSCALYGYPIKEKFPRILLLGAMLAGVSVLVRALPIQAGVNAIIQLPVFIITTALILRISLLRGVLFVLSSMVMLMVVEIAVFPLFSKLSGHSIKYISEHNTWLFVGGWINLMLIMALIAVIKMKNITLLRLSAASNSTNSKQNRNATVFTLLLAGQVSVAVFFTAVMYLSTYGNSPAFNNQTVILVAGGMLLGLSMVSGFFIRRVYLNSEQEAVIESYETFMDNINNLFTVVRGQRHDFIHHVQVIYSLQESGSIEDSKNYMRTLMQEIQVVNESIQVKNPVLNALFNAKKAVAEACNVSLELEIRDDGQNTKLKPLDMVKIMGNLIDNAIEAVKDEPVEYRKVRVKLEKYAAGQVYEVSNMRPVIDEEVISKMFESGYSTKGEHHGGLGLASVRELIDKYGGEIGVKSNIDNGTVFTVVIPYK